MRRRRIMASYVVLTPPDAAGDEEAVLVRDGFSWLAFIMPVIWFAWHRMWLWAAAFVVAGLAIAVALDRTDWDGTAILVAFLMALWVGLEAHGQRIGALVDRGWTIRDVIVASGRDVAEATWFRALRLQPRPAASGARAVPAAVTRPSGGPALGLLDYDGGN